MIFDEEVLYGFTIDVRRTGVRTNADFWSLIGPQLVGQTLVLIIS